MSICAPSTPDVIEQTEAVLADYFQRGAQRASARGDAHLQLWLRAAASARGGKRIRPRLLLSAHTHLGGLTDSDAALAAAAFEVLHTALILHDDVLDGDLVRRGRPNLAGVYASDALDQGTDAAAATRWGAAAALIAGDVLVSGAHSLLARIQHHARATLHELLDECMATTAGGELVDVGASLGLLHPSHDQLLAMMEHKTAVYSFAAPLQAGALLADAGDATVDALGGIGRLMGVLFQMRDDVIGVFGAEGRTGKSVMGDLREGKRTLLIAYAEGTPHWQRVRHLFGRPAMDATDAQVLRGALHECGAVQRMHETSSIVQQELHDVIDSAGLPPALASELHTIGRQCVERQS